MFSTHIIYLNEFRDLMKNVLLHYTNYFYSRLKLVQIVAVTTPDIFLS